MYIKNHCTTTKYPKITHPRKTMLKKMIKICPLEITQMRIRWGFLRKLRDKKHLIVQYL